LRISLSPEPTASSPMSLSGHALELLGLRCLRVAPRELRRFFELFA
jgi:hypothetical protein